MCLRRFLERPAKKLFWLGEPPPEDKKTQPKHAPRLVHKRRERETCCDESLSFSVCAYVSHIWTRDFFSTELKRVRIFVEGSERQSMRGKRERVESESGGKRNNVGAYATELQRKKVKCALQNN